MKSMSRINNSQYMQREIATHIIQGAKTFGASLAGLTDVASVIESSSHRIYRNARFPADGKSVFVIALAHPTTEPSLDWWDRRAGGSPGNRRMVSIADRIADWVEEEFDIKARLLPYHPEGGGIFLKDAAVLAGLGVIGANNLLITREYGPRIRLRALSLDAELRPTGPIDFSPCDSCDMRCREVCPQRAFGQGSYSRDLCMKQMTVDEANREVLEKDTDEDSPRACVKYCRACELACPVGQGS
jgi:epoxyqueuosine reductase